MPDVRLPDGRIIRDVPDGITQSELMGRLDRADRRARVEERIASNPAEFDPSSAEFQARFGPTSASSRFENFLAGAGKAAIDTARGFRQLLGSDTVQAEIDESRRLDEPLLNTTSGLVGNITGNVGIALAPGAIATRAPGAATRLSQTIQALSNPNTVRTAAASGAALGAVQPVATDESRSFNVGAGLVGGAVGQRLARPIANRLSQAGNDAVELLRNAGVPLDAAQRSGSRALEVSRALLDDSIFTAGGQEAFGEAQARGFTRAVLRTIGEDADQATPAVLRRARNRIGRVFDEIAETSPPRFDQELMGQLVEIGQTARRALTAADQRVLARNLRDIVEANQGGFINGNRFNRIRSNLGRLTTRPDIGEFAGMAQDALVGALRRSSPAQADALDVAVQQFRNLRNVQSAIDKGSDRFINPLRLSNALQNKRNQNLSLFGLGGELNLELADLARAGREVLPDAIGNSGTAARQQQLSRSLLDVGVGALALPLGGQSLLNSQRVAGRLLTGELPGLAGAVARQAPSAQGRNIQSQIFERDFDFEPPLQ